MIKYLIGGLLAASLGCATPAMAQHTTGASLAAVAQSNTGAGTSVATPAPPFSPDSIFINPDVRPQYTGGEAALRNYMVRNIRYPEQAMRKHLTGKVYVRFVLSATGKVTDASVVRGPGSGLNEEALRLVWLMPPWQPARQRGQPVRVSCTIPIDFQE